MRSMVLGRIPCATSGKREQKSGRWHRLNRCRLNVEGIQGRQVGQAVGTVVTVGARSKGRESVGSGYLGHVP